MTRCGSVVSPRGRAQQAKWIERLSFLWWRRALHRSIAMHPIRRRAIAARAADAHEPAAQSAARSTAS